MPLLESVPPPLLEEWTDEAMTESHYFVNGGFIEEGTLLSKDSIDKIRKIPTVIVQGRYDMVCPMDTAWKLHCAFPEANFVSPPVFLAGLDLGS